eukprot:jgi/Ulvmu1/1319/UM011_0047.1
MLGLRQARTSVLSPAVVLVETIGAQARDHSINVVHSINQKLESGKGLSAGACSRLLHNVSSDTRRGRKSTLEQGLHMLPVIARDYSTSPGNDHEAPRPASDQDRAEHGNSSSESVEMGEDRMKSVLLDKALSYVASQGWTVKAIQSAAEDMDLSPVFAGMCDGKEKDLVEHFIRSCNQQLFARLRDAGPEFTSLSTADKIKLAVRWRLEMITPYINTWPQAMAAMATADKIATALELMAELIDGIWEAAEGSGAGSSKQSRRVVLQVIYTTTELYMLTDFSPGHADTWQALDRRVEDALALGEGAQHLEKSVMEVFNRLQTFGRP